MAGQGVLKIISGGARDVPCYHTGAYVVSNKAYDSGVTSVAAWAGKKIAITKMGSPYHYSLALLAMKYGIDLKGIQLLPVQSVPNEIAAISGNKADASILPVPVASPMVDRGAGHLMGFTGDEAPWQFGILFASTETLTSRPAVVARFLRALHRGAQDYHAAFSGPNEQRRDGPTASTIEALLAKSSGQPLARIKLSISYIDAKERLDVEDVERQIAKRERQG